MSAIPDHAKDPAAIAPTADTPPQTAPWHEQLRQFSRAVWAREEQLFLLVAVIIGLFSGLVVVCFHIAIDWVRISALGSSLHPPIGRLLIAPTVGGLIVAYLVIRLFPRVRGSGVNQTKAAVYIYDGYIPFSTVIGKFITCALAIGTGQSLGPEDPALQMGAGIASALGRRLRFSREKLRMVAPVGAAAGLAAAFNTPITAVLFVIEEVIGKWSAGVLGAVVLASVSSVVVERLFLGDAPLFRVPAYHLLHPAELVSYAIVGVVGGLASVGFVKLVAFARPRLKALPRSTQYFQPAAAGLILGMIGIWLPQVLGAGYDVMDQSMHDQYAWKMLALLGLFKILSTSISFVSGTPGGMFAPTLFMGAMVGGAVGDLEQKVFFPHIPGAMGHLFSTQMPSPVGAFALVGMGTMFAGILRAPMTSVFMILEISGNYSIIIPVIISNGIAYLISRKYQPVAIFDMLARQDGMDLPSMEEQREESERRVEEAMRSPAGSVLKGDETVEAALKQVAELPDRFFIVYRHHGLWTGITREDLHKAAATDGSARLRSVLGTTRLPVLHPDQTLEVALRRMGEYPLLPVVHRADYSKLEGVISLQDILKVYRDAAVPLPAIPDES
ncbi:MAG TPA: chloride channel protein [Terriglobia bacterium]|nr:chloride channel protein [Terriglobia bacterium]